MAGARKLQAEIDRTLKKVEEGVAEFDSLQSKVEECEGQALKAKMEDELKKELKKLQKHRDRCGGVARCCGVAALSAKRCGAARSSGVARAAVVGWRSVAALLFARALWSVLRLLAGIYAARVRVALGCAVVPTLRAPPFPARAASKRGLRALRSR